MAEPAIIDPTPKPEATENQLRSRTATIWTIVVVFLAVLVVLLVFLLQNSQTVHLKFLGIHGSLSLAVAMLLSAVIGGVLVALAGGARILQLRRLTHHSH
jgi:uncharacterized integral membrane protein